MATPGYYKVNYRALRIRELIGMHGFTRGLRHYWISRFMSPKPAGWMPGLWANRACEEEDLSEFCRLALKPHRADMERLGFTPVGWFNSKEHLNPIIRDAGGVAFLDPSRCHFGQVIFTSSVNPATGVQSNQIVIAFTAVFRDDTFSVTNNKLTFESPSDATVLRLSALDAGQLHQEFLRQLAARHETPASFPDIAALQRWFDLRQEKTHDERVRRRLFVPMTDAEVAEARKRLANGTLPQPAGPQFKIRWALWLLVVAAIIALQFLKHARHPDGAIFSNATITYQGRPYQLRKSYASFEDYKDDPFNLATNELDRIEKAMTSVPAPPSFKNRQQLIRFVFDLNFPGYGCGGIPTQTDEGSVLEAMTVEIPQKDKDRYLVVRHDPGDWTVVDDFVHETSTNAIAYLKLEKQKLLYYNARDEVVREKPLQR